MKRERVFRRFAVAHRAVTIGGYALLCATAHLGAGCSSTPLTSNAERQVPDQTVSADKMQEIQNDPNIPMAQKQAMIAAQQRQSGQQATQKDAALPPAASVKK